MSARGATAWLLRGAIAIGASAFVAGCGPEPSADIKGELTRIRQDVRGRVEPLPEVRPYRAPELRIERNPFAGR